MPSEESTFIHLHNHTQYSLLDGACRIDELVQTAAKFEQPAVAITDHGNLFGAVEFHKSALAAGVKPIIGCEVYVSPRSRHEKRDASGIQIHGEYAFHLILLCENAEGYNNLMQLVSLGYIEGFYHRPRVDKELLRAHSNGLIALSACIGGEIPSRILQGNREKAEELAQNYLDIFGPDHFFLEIQDHKMKEEAEVNPILAEIGRNLHIPLVATNDCHYLGRNDAEAHDILLCIQTGKTYDEEERLRFPSKEFYFKSSDEMRALFAQFPEAIENTVSIAERCNFSFSDKEYHLPRFQVPEGQDLESYFEATVRRGFEKRMNAIRGMAERGELRRPLAEYDERLEMELDVIRRMGFPGYFLIVWDVIRHAREQGIPVGPGRGSAVGSLVSYSLAITDLDPLQYDLLFERFLNPDRLSMPDIDIDFCKRRRDEAIEHVRRKYGSENVAQIITFGTLKARQTIRDVGRVLEMPYTEVDRIAKMIPLSPGAKVKDGFDVEAFKKLFDEDKRVKKLVNVARRLEGLSRHASTHAAGVVIAPGKITDYCPLFKGSTGDILTQFAMNQVEAIGLLKMDFLGLRTLTVIDDTLKSISEDQGTSIDLTALTLDDKPTFQLLGEGRTGGVFQFEKSGAREILRRLRPDCFEDLIAVNALNRPGPLQGGMVEDFIERRHGKRVGKALVPQIEEILQDTYGILVYQEQVMRIAQAVSGFTKGQADDLRKAMSKKLTKKMAVISNKFRKGAVQLKIEPDNIDKIWELISKFGEYGFNKSHSTAYALLAYQTAYLKAHYPVHFMSSLLTSEKNTPDKMVDYLAECRDMGIQVLPPDINESDMDFSVRGDKIRFGLSAVKNVGEGAIESILEARARANGRFHSFFQFFEEVDLRLNNRRVIESLIRCGGFDSLGYHRARIWAALDRAMEAGQRRQTDRERGQHSLFGEQSGLDEDRMEESKQIPDVPPWPEEEILGYEKELLGYYVTGHPLTRYSQLISEYATTNIKGLPSVSEKNEAAIGGIITSLQRKKTKKGNMMAVFVLEDLEGRTEVVVFPADYTRCQEQLTEETPVMVTGTVERAESSFSKDDKGDDRDQTTEEERVRLLVSDVFPLNLAPEKLAGKISIRIKVDEEVDRTMDSLRRLLYEHTGDIPVQLKLVFPGKYMVTVRPASTYFLNPSSEATCQIEKLLGNDAMTFHRGPSIPRRRPRRRGFTGKNGQRAWMANGRNGR